MSRSPKTTTAPTGSIAPLGLRLLPELRQKIETSARANGRSLNAEVSARLQASFEPTPTAALPFAIEEAITQEQEARGGTRDEAHLRMAKLATANGGTLLSIKMTPNMSIKEFVKMLEASKVVVPPDASLIVERE